MKVPLTAQAESPPDVEHLCTLAQTGDTAAFEGLYRATVGRIHGLCLRMTGNMALAEDCTQNTYVRAWQKIGDFRGQSAITTWLHRIAVNEVLGAYRRENRHEHEEESHVEALSTATSDDPDLERAIAELPERMRQVFVLFAIYGYGHKETALMLGIAEGTSKAQYHQARRQLQRLLGENDA